MKAKRTERRAKGGEPKAAKRPRNRVSIILEDAPDGRVVFTLTYRKAIDGTLPPQTGAERMAAVFIETYGKHIRTS